MTRRIVTVIIGIGFGVGLILFCSEPAHAGTTSDSITWKTVGTRAIPCKHEDTVPKKGQPPCYWDAHLRGNGKGTSFVVWSSGWRMYLR